MGSGDDFGTVSHRCHTTVNRRGPRKP